jgi:S1-C subfamily serine protease
MVARMHPHDARSAVSARRGRLVAAAVAACVTALLVLTLALRVGGDGGSTGTPTIASLAAAARTSLATQPPDVFGRIPSIVRRVQPNVVTVLTPQGVGSGVVYRANGVILTNEHVVRGQAAVEIAFADGQRVSGKVTASDPDTDLALVKVGRTGLPAASFERKLPPVGALAVVLGSPLGFEKSVSAGIVSGLHRSLPGSARETRALVDLLQTDAPISPGNSGGAVVDARGRVIGITEAYVPPQQGAVAIGFAIPADTAVRVADQLLRNGRVEHAFVGIQPAELTPELAQALGIARSTGVLVYAVERGGPAARAGIEPGDVLIALAGRPLESVEQLFAALRLHRPGQTVTVALVRDGKRQSVAVRLSKTPG